MDGGGREELRSHRKNRLCVYLCYQLNTLPSNNTNNAKLKKKIVFATIISSFLSALTEHNCKGDCNQAFTFFPILSYVFFCLQDLGNHS